MRASLVFLTFLGAATIARAEPTLDVRARASLEAHPTRDDGGNTRVRVVLTDDIGAPIRRGRVSLSLHDANGRCGSPTTCLTDAEGTCSARLVGCAGAAVEASYDGTEEVDGSRVVVPVLDHGTEPRIRVTIVGGEVVDLDAASATVEISMDGIASMPARASLADEIGHPMLSRRVDARATLRFELPTSSLGPPGIGAIQATVEFDDGSRATARTMITRRLRTTLVLRRGEESLVARLRTARSPIANALVSLVDDGHVVETRRTGNDGRVTFEVHEDDAAHAFVARYEPNDPGHAPSHSSVVRVAGTRSRAWAAYAPLGSLALALVLFGVLRRREPVVEPTQTRRLPPPVTVQVATRKDVLASRMNIRFRVLAHEDDRPLRDARVQIEGEGVVLTCDDAGEYAYVFGGATSHSLLFEAPNRVPERVRVRVPHRGEWEDAIVRLETTRAHARRAIDAVARAVRTDEDAADVLTLREAERELRGATDPEFVGDTDAIVYGSAVPPLDEARAIVARAQARVDDAARP